MSRIIMLIPLDQDISLTTLTLSIMYFFNKKVFKKKTDKSILYLSCTNDFLDHTKFIFNKYFSKFVDILDNIDFSKEFFNSPKYLFLLNKIIEEYYNKKFLYELVLIEGINSNYNLDFEQINYDISQNLSAEVIFVVNLKNSSLESIKEKEKKIKIFLERRKYKNILGIIFNKINSPFIEKKYNFIQKLIILNKIKQNQKDLIVHKKLFKSDFFSIIACIPWNKTIKEINLIEIYNFLNIQVLYLSKKNTDSIEDIIIFDENSINQLNEKKINILIIVSYSHLDVFLKTVNVKINNNIKGIILTEVSNNKKYIFSLCNILIKRYISIFFTEENTIEILYQLQNLNFKIHLKNRIYINKIQKYISSFFCYSSIMFPQNKNNCYIGYSPKEFCCHLKLLSRKSNKRIILPESYDVRILKAVSQCENDNIARCILLGDTKKIYQIAHDQGINLSKKIEIINPVLVRYKYISRFLEIRKKKGANEFSAKKALEDNIVLATLMLESSEVDGLVSGAVNTTANTIRPALQLIKTSSNHSLVSSVFFMLLPNQVLIYADCAINIDPTAEELAEIAIQSADSSKIFGIEPRIAMLSYSTGFSGTGHQVEKIRNATNIVRNRRPDLIVDGPIQYDAAVSKTVFKLKTPYSPISGSATILVFPDLNSGNIAYKAVQRSANLISIGPMLQGLKKPVNDLSRGASVEDIIYTIALTSIQST